MLTNEKLEEIGELAGKATYKPFDSEHERNLSDACDSEIIEEMAKEILSLRAVLDGLPPEAIAGGWTAKGIRAHAKRLECELDELKKQQPVAWTDEQELRDLAAHNCAYLYKIDPDNPYHDPRRQIMLYRAPVPLAVSQPLADGDAKFDTAKLINKFYERYPLNMFKCDGDRAESLGYFMAGAELQHFGDFIAFEDTDDDA
ncbi:hypothetical protein [Pectobacterium versatile]|uniref:hypothetical protein n=1 Tax=Pectobacterium versatile TaxID=2488639 RepID=UPI001CCD2257|nr:hypothetical protein [Pectobacterium versatile]